MCSSITLLIGPLEVKFGVSVLISKTIRDMDKKLFTRYLLSTKWHIGLINTKNRCIKYFLVCLRFWKLPLWHEQNLLKEERTNNFTRYIYSQFSVCPSVQSVNALSATIHIWTFFFSFTLYFSQHSRRRDKDCIWLCSCISYSFPDYYANSWFWQWGAL